VSGFLESLVDTTESTELTTRTAELLDDIKEFLARFVVYPSQYELTAHVLWIAHAWPDGLLGINATNRVLVTRAE
jgi:hypothetical protein